MAQVKAVKFAELARSRYVTSAPVLRKRSMLIDNSKCDETRPFCRRCATACRVCPGYDNFRCKPSKLVNRAPPTSSDTPYSITPLQKKSVAAEQPTLSIISGLSPTSDEVSTCLLFTQVAPNSGKLTETILDLVSPLYSRASPHPALSMATEALAMGHLSSISGLQSHRVETISRYVKALHAIRAALQDTSTYESSEPTESLLLGILSLCLLKVSCSASHVSGV